MDDEPIVLTEADEIYMTILIYFIGGAILLQQGFEKNNVVMLLIGSGAIIIGFIYTIRRYKEERAHVIKKQV